MSPATLRLEFFWVELALVFLPVIGRNIDRSSRQPRMYLAPWHHACVGNSDDGAYIVGIVSVVIRLVLELRDIDLIGQLRTAGRHI